jgi:uncharacterized repeat protein (TIGR01451 family)
MRTILRSRYVLEKLLHVGRYGAGVLLVALFSVISTQAQNCLPPQVTLVSPVVGGSNTVCIGQSTSLIVGATPATSLTVIAPAGVTLTGPGQSGLSPGLFFTSTITGIAAGVNTFTIVATNGVTSCSTTTTFPIIGVPQPVVSPVNLSLCVGSTISIGSLTGPGGSLSALSGFSNTLRLGSLETGPIQTGPVSISAGVNTFNVVSGLPNILAGPLSCSLTTPITITGIDPALCAGNASLTLDKRVSSSTATVGSSLTYTMVLTNTGATAASTIVRDSIGAAGTYVAGSAVFPGGTVFTPGSPVSLWSVPSIAAGQSLTLTYAVTVNAAGILYNRATIPTDTASVCTSIPIRVCAGEAYTFRLTVAPGRSLYQWFRNGVAIPNQSTNILDITQPGSYSVAVDNATGLCPDFSCCPFIVIEDPLPLFAARTVSATCLGSVAQANGQIILSGFDPTYRFQFSAGATFNAAASQPATIIPANGIIAANLANPANNQLYTVRVYNSSGCFSDVTVTLAPTVCVCPPSPCVPLAVSRIR